MDGAVTQTQTEPALDTPTQWPPIAHIARKKPGTVKEGDVALCGAKLMGINLDSAYEVCEKCKNIFTGRKP